MAAKLFIALFWIAMAGMILNENHPESPISILLAYFAIGINSAYIIYTLIHRGKRSVLDTLIIFISVPLVLLSLYFDTNTADPLVKKIFFICLLSLPFALLIRRDVKLHRKQTALKTQIQNWPSTMGIIVHSEAKYETDGAYVTPIIVYEYQVDGILYQADLISPQELFQSVTARSISSHQDAYDLVQAYPEGNRVTVYYNPNDFQQAFIMLPNENARDL